MPAHVANLTIFFSAWFLLAVAAGQGDVWRALPRPVLQAVLFGLLTLLLVLPRMWGDFRDFVRSLSLRTLILLHLTRFVGIVFLQMHAADRLPGEFAISAGWGDIAVASVAIVAAILAPRPGARRFIQAWNVIAFLELLMVVATAAKLGLTAPASMIAITQLPMCLLPTFLVPILLASHVILFGRLRRDAAATSESGALPIDATESPPAQTPRR
jgi:hypothetical protein